MYYQKSVFSMTIQTRNGFIQISFRAANCRKHYVYFNNHVIQKPPYKRRFTYNYFKFNTRSFLQSSLNRFLPALFPARRSFRPLSVLPPHLRLSTSFLPRDGKNKRHIFPFRRTIAMPRPFTRTLLLEMFFQVKS